MPQRSLFKSLSWGTSSYMPWEVGDIFGFGCQTLIWWPQYTSADGPNIASAPELDPWRDPLCSWSVHSFWPAPLPARRSSPGSLQQMLCCAHFGHHRLDSFSQCCQSSLLSTCVGLILFTFLRSLSPCCWQTCHESLGWRNFLFKAMILLLCVY